MGPHHQGLTRLLNWKEKGSKHFYIAIRAKINRGALTIKSEESINYILRQVQTVDFFNGMYRNTSKIKCNLSQKYQESMTGMNRQALNLQLSKQNGMGIRPACPFCKIRRDNPRSKESQIHFYSECIYTQIFWTDIKDWAQPTLTAQYTIRDRLLGISREDAYSMRSTLLREARFTKWGE